MSPVGWDDEVFADDDYERDNIDLDAVYEKALADGVLTKEELEASFQRFLERHVCAAVGCDGLALEGKWCVMHAAYWKEPTP